ncbi:MAG: helix-turn-helix domain-containing protein [Halobacteriales archaeon]|nr:helix-turn-helix domain-containing protein [Halobacteriales archaeon]
MGGKDEPEESVKLATEKLQQLGLKEYEAKVFVALCRVPMSTAKRVSELSGVPRPRVYDAIRILEARGLVEVEHSSPKKFRAIPLDEATSILQDRYDSRIKKLQEALNEMEVVEAEGNETSREVWSMSDRASIDNRTKEMIEDADEELFFVVGDHRLLNESLVESLGNVGADVSLYVGVPTESLRNSLRDKLQGVRMIDMELGWLNDSTAEDEPTVGRLVLTDSDEVLVSSFVTDTSEEHAIYGTGFGNGLVTIARHVISPN